MVDNPGASWLFTFGKQIVAAALLSTACASAAGQTNSIEVSPQPQVNNQVDTSRVIGSTVGVTTFRAEARQVLLGVLVRKRTPDSRQPDKSLIPEDAAKHFPPDVLGIAVAFAKKLDDGLAASDFRVFDNGTEQHINYFKKSTLPLEDVKGLWSFWPGSHGTWGFPPSDATYSIQIPAIKYVIGYVPPPLEPGKCHDIRVVVADRDVQLDRNRYCVADRSDDLDEAMREGADPGTKMRLFANSEASGSLKVWAQAFTFWSSGVLSLVTENLAVERAAPVSDLTYVVEVHDSKAPATVHLAVEFVPPWKHWDPDCPNKPVLYVVGIAYNGNHEIARQFGATFRCRNVRDIFDFTHLLLPSRFDVQIALTPGDYDFRAVVSDGKKRFGKVRFPLRVEWFDGRRLAISDVVLSRFPRDASRVLEDTVMVSPELLNPTPLISKNIQFIPGTEVRIREHDRLPLYFEVYEPILKTQITEVYIHIKVTNLKTGSVVLDSGVVRAADWVLPGNPVVPVGFNLGTHELAKGDYRVDVQASDGAGRQSEWRESKFSID